MRRDGAQGQGLAPGVGAGGDAVVDGGAEELLEPVVGFEVERGVLVVAEQQSLPFEGAGCAGGDGMCCFSHSFVGSPRELVGVFRRRISWDDGVMREPAGAGDVAFSMNRCCRSGENVDARAPSVGKGWASAAHLSMPCPHGP